MASNIKWSNFLEWIKEDNRLPLLLAGGAIGIATYRVCLSREQAKNALPTRAEDIVKLLDLVPHPEGGFFRETYRTGIEG